MVILGLARAVAWSMMSRLVRQYRHATPALKHLRDIGYGYRESTFRSDWKKWVTWSETARALKRIPLERKIPPRIIVKAEDVFVPRYRYRVHMRYGPIEPGEVQVKTIDIMSRELLTQSEILTKSRLRAAELADKYDVTEIPTLQVVEVAESAGL